MAMWALLLCPIVPHMAPFAVGRSAEHRASPAMPPACHSTTPTPQPYGIPADAPAMHASTSYATLHLFYPAPASGVCSQSHEPWFHAHHGDIFRTLVLQKRSDAHSRLFDARRAVYVYRKPVHVWPTDSVLSQNVPRLRPSACTRWPGPYTTSIFVVSANLSPSLAKGKCLFCASSSSPTRQLGHKLGLGSLGCH